MQIVDTLLSAGASIVALRMGAEGALIASHDVPAPVHIPAADAQVVDVTGCGNAFNGGLLAALQRGHTLSDAGAWGAAAASCMAEAEGAHSWRKFLCMPVEGEAARVCHALEITIVSAHTSNHTAARALDQNGLAHVTPLPMPVARLFQRHSALLWTDWPYNGASMQGCRSMQRQKEGPSWRPTL